MKFSRVIINYPISVVSIKVFSIKLINASIDFIYALEPSISNKSKCTSDNLL